MQKKEEDLAEEDDGGEFVMRKCDEEKDDEETIAEEEKLQNDTDYQSELDDLQKEGISKLGHNVVKEISIINELEVTVINLTSQDHL